MKNQELSIVKEGTTKCFVFKNKSSSKGPGTKKGSPFYNPAMELNRDLSIVFVQWLLNKKNTHLDFIDGLASSGIRGIRLANEVDGDFNIAINDWNEQAYLQIKKNIELNTLKNAIACNKNLNVLLSEEKFDYIDIDPFGSPVYYIDSAIRSIKNEGIIACTATDTAALCGRYENACMRRYAARSFHSYLMKEMGLRILLGFLCRVAAKFDKGIKPIISYSDDHYFRTYVLIRSGKRLANESMENYSLININDYIAVDKNIIVGPLWLGKIHDIYAVKEIRTLLFKKELNTKNSIWKLLSLLEEEANAPLFFFTSEYLASFKKTPIIKLEIIIEELKKNGFFVSKTQFSPIGFKTDAAIKDLIEIFEK